MAQFLGSTPLDPGGRVFLRDNFAVDATGSAIPMADALVARLPAPPSFAPPLPPTDPLSNAELALRSAGSRPAHRDPVDAAIVQSIIRGTGHIIDSQEQAGGYPVRAETHRVLDVPEEVDARRAWLTQLSRELSTDATLDVTPLWKRLRVAR
jgi:hypothetical protein